CRFGLFNRSASSPLNPRALGSPRFPAEPAMPEAALALDIRGLSKSFDRPVVTDLDLAVRGGEFYALLGPNGAGKTTLLRMVAGLLQPEAGSISVFGIDTRAEPLKAKSIIAWVSDEPMVYDRLTPLE